MYITLSKNIFPKTPMIEIKNHNDPSSVFKYFNKTTDDDAQGGGIENETVDGYSESQLEEEEEQTLDLDDSNSEEEEVRLPVRGQVDAEFEEPAQSYVEERTLLDLELEEDSKEN